MYTNRIDTCGKPTGEINANENHHPFCNFFGIKREGCEQCEYLYRKYPTDDASIETCVGGYFPDVIIR